MRYLLLLAAALANSAFALVTEPVPASEAPPANALAPVIVNAPEPKYVAPTLRDRIGRIWAPVLINGKGPFRLVLDTGANGTAIIPSVAQTLGIPVRESDKIQLHGVTGSAVVPMITIDNMEVGDLLIEDARVPIVADVFGGAEGVLGGKGLHDKRIFIDFRHDLIRIERSMDQTRSDAYRRIPMSLTRGQLPMLELQIGTIRTKAILDTGAQQTIGNQSLREALMRRPRDGKDTSIIGVTLDVATGRAIGVPPINIGGIEVRNMNITFGDMYIFEQWKMTKEPTMLIGMDVIGSLDALVIDYKRRELLVRTRR